MGEEGHSYEERFEQEECVEPDLTWLEGIQKGAVEGSIVSLSQQSEEECKPVPAVEEERDIEQAEVEERDIEPIKWDVPDKESKSVSAADEEQGLELVIAEYPLGPRCIIL